jgi:hypothetical protein
MLMLFLWLLSLLHHSHDIDVDEDGVEDEKLSSWWKIMFFEGF